MNGFQSVNPDGVLVRSKDGRNFVLQEIVDFVSEDGNTYRMPVGATSDGASTPPEIWLNFPPFGSYWLAAFLHDCAYRNTLEVFDIGEQVWSRASLSKATCDSLLKEAMDYAGTHEFTKEAIYNGVVIGGGSSFEADRKVQELAKQAAT